MPSGAPRGAAERTTAVVSWPWMLSMRSPLPERIVIVDRDPDARHAWEASTTSRWLDFEVSYREFLAVRKRPARLRQEHSA